MENPILKSSLLGLVMALSLGTNAHAQDVLGVYTAFISPQDLRNSGGTRLSEPGQILAQDRANFHRFDIRQPGDAGDAYFGQRSARAALPGMLARGQMDGAARSIVMGGGVVTVEILGQGGRPYALRVSTGGMASAGSNLASGGAHPVAQVDDRWGFRRVAASDAAMAQVTGTNARVALECSRSGAGVSPSDRMTLRVTLLGGAPLPPGPVALEAVVDGRSQGSLTMMSSAGSLEGAVPSGSALVAALGVGNRLSLSHSGMPLLEAGLSGSSAALAALAEFCATPAEMPLSAALAAAPEVARPQTITAQQGTVAGTTGEGPVARGLEGENAIRQQLALWLLGQRPSLVRDAGFVTQLENEGLPDGYPVYQRPAHPNGQLSLQETQAFLQSVNLGRIAYLDRVATRAASEAVPARVTLDVPARVLRPGPGMPNRLDLGGFGTLSVNHNLQPSVPNAIRTLQLSLGANTGRVLMRASAPLLLPLPEDILAHEPPTDLSGRPGYDVFPTNDQYLRVTLALSDPRALLPQGEERARSGGTPVAEIAAEMVEAGLFRKPRTRRNEPPAAEVLLASWRRDAAVTPAIAPLNTLAAFAGTYASGIEDGRLLNLSHQFLEGGGRLRTVGSMGQSPGVAARSADLLIRAGAVLKRTPDRDFAPDALQSLLEQLVDPLSRDGMIPPGFFGESGAMNEITRARILRDAGPKLAAYIRERAPTLPLPVRSRGLAQLGNYDIGAEVFAFSLSPDQLTYLPTPSRNRTLDGALDGLIDALPVPLDAAEALLTQLEQDNLPGRSVPARLDMRLISAQAMPQSGGPITMDELQRVVLTWQPEQLAITADLYGQQPLLSLEFASSAAAAPGDSEVPEAVYATTAETLLGAWAARHGTPEELARDLASGRDFRRRMGQAPQSVIEARALEEAERLIASAQDSFWIGLSIQMGTYDVAAQRIPLTDIAIFPVPSRMGENVDGLPRLHFPDREAFDHLPATPDEYALIAGLDGGRHALIFASVAPAEEQDGNGRLTLKRPDQLLFLRENGNGGVSVALSKDLGAAPRLGLASSATPTTEGMTAPATPVVSDGTGKAVGLSTSPVPPFEVPGTLRLDAEGLDLLALSLRPDLYDVRALRRMFVERLARERADQREGRSPQWGAFFANPTLELAPSQIEGMLPDFAAWSRARAAALPDRLRLTVALSGQHPETGCRAAMALPHVSVADRAVVAQLAGILPGGIPTAPVSPVSNVTKPGGPALHVVAGRPTHPTGAGGASECGFIELRGTASDLAAARTGLDGGAAPYVDALVQAEVPQVNRITPSGPQSVDYLLEVEDIRFQPLTPLSGDQSGLVGALVIAAGVSAVETWQFDKTTRTIIQAERYDRNAWQSLLPSQDTSTYDILGLRRGSPLAEIEALVAERMPNAIRHLSPPVAKAGIYDHAVGFSTPDRDEVILSIYDSGDETSPAVALMRYRFLSPGSATVEAVRQAMMDKYGPADRESGDTLAWGVPSQEIDPAQVCGGHKTFGNGNAPQLTPERSMDEIRASTPDGTYQAPEWGYYGWPAALGEYAEYQRTQAEDYCGQVVLARIRSDVYEVGSVDLTVWILDKPNAERLAVEAAKAAVVPELDMDL